MRPRHTTSVPKTKSIDNWSGGPRSGSPSGRQKAKEDRGTVSTFAKRVVSEDRRCSALSVASR